MPSSAPRQSNKARLERCLADFIAENGVPGATAAVLAPRTSLQVACGFSDLDAGEPMRADSVMPAGSIGKSFVGALCLDLAREGRLDLDAPIGTWLGEEPWFARIANADRATLRMLLNHTAGIADHREAPAFFETLQAVLSGPDADAQVAPERLVDFVADAPASFEPGAGFAYSETGYILAGLIVRKVTGRDPLALIEQRLLKPLKLKRITAMASRWTPGLANGHVADRSVGFPAKSVRDGALAFHPGTEFTGGGFYASSGDLAHWARALYEGGAMDGGYLPELLHSAPTGDPREVGYGLGARIMATPHGLAYGHYGEFPGYMSLMAYYPAARMAIAAQINSWPHDRSLLAELQDGLFAAIHSERP